MNLDKWTQQLHDKLAEHEVAPPEGLWEEIAPLCPPSRGRSRFVALRRWAAVAAAAAAAVAMLLAPLSPPEAPLSPPRRGELGAPLSPPGRGELEAHLICEQSVTAVRAEGRREVETTAQAEPPTEPATADSQTERRDVAEAVAEAETTATDKPTTTDEVQAVVSELERQIVSLSGPAQKRPLTIGLYAMNGFSGQSSSNGVLMAEEMARKYREVYEYSYATAARSTEPIYLTGYEERQHHHRPVSYGLTVSYPLTERLSLTTGLVYTKLSSDFTQVMNKMQIRREQTLHYVGVPLGVSYRLWSMKGLRAYTSAGALTYLNVATHVVTEGVEQEMEKDRVQLSLNGSLGLQYDVVPQIGLYVEPGLSYYPDNRSHIQNFFKDKPVNLSLQVGLRVNVE